MKVRALLVTLAGFTLITGGSASAAPLAYGNYYDESATTSCISAYNCQLNFDQTPTDKLVMIRKVNCYVQSSAPLAFSFLNIATTNGGAPIARFLPLPVPSAAAGTSYSTNFDADVHWLIGQGRFPLLNFGVAVAASFSVYCTITGDLVTPIP